MVMTLFFPKKELCKEKMIVVCNKHIHSLAFHLSCRKQGGKIIKKQTSSSKKERLISRRHERCRMPKCRVWFVVVDENELTEARRFDEYIVLAIDEKVEGKPERKPPKFVSDVAPEKTKLSPPALKCYARYNFSFLFSLFLVDLTFQRFVHSALSFEFVLKPYTK